MKKRAHNLTKTFVVRKASVHTLAEARRLVHAHGGEKARLTSDDATAYRFVLHDAGECSRESHRPTIAAGGRLMILYCGDAT